MAASWGGGWTPLRVPNPSPRTARCKQRPVRLACHKAGVDDDWVLSKRTDLSLEVRTDDDSDR
jgi:hypothetical protein